MKFCLFHWNELRERLKDYGIDHLSAKNKEIAIEDITEDVDEIDDRYDPLMDCYWMITNRALELGGPHLILPKEDGTEYCPVCEAIINGATQDEWINGPVEAALLYCRQVGLVPRVS